MNYSELKSNNATIKIAQYGANNGEIHAIATIADNQISFDAQLCEIQDVVKNFKSRIEMENYNIIAIRILLSDAANQAKVVLDSFGAMLPNCALAYVQQPPLNGTKIAIVLYAMQYATPTRIDTNTIMVEKNGYTHLWSANVCSAMANTHAETHSQLSYLEQMLESRQLSIANNCVRTWFYVQNIDVNYAAVVEARRNNFDNNNLTTQTHYIASTGIGGRHANKEITSVMDAYSVGGLVSGQMRYLYATANMNRTSDYGVTFERGTYVDYADRRQIYISGTASIDNKGNVVAEGDIEAQTHRMWDNVEALLTEANSSWTDIAHVVVYLRDIADYAVVNRLFSEKMKQTPFVITLAPVCRPGWLIEMECMAISKKETMFSSL